MKNRLFAAFASALVFLLAAPVYADSIVHIWSCTLEEGKTPSDAVDVSKAWLKAAQGMKGGKDIEVYLEAPIAANVGDGSFNFVLIIPDATTWGVFNDAYENSTAAEADEAFAQVAGCSSSSLWESIKIE